MVVLDDGGCAETAVHEGVALASAHGAALVFVDISVPDALPWADELAMSAGAHERLLSAFQQAGQGRVAAALAAAQAAALPARVLSVGSPHDIATAAVGQRCDVIVVAHPGRNAVMRLLSADLVPMLITEASVPVLVCRRASENPAVA